MDAPYRVPAILHELSATCSPLTGNTLFAWDLPSVTASATPELDTFKIAAYRDKEIDLFPFSFGHVLEHQEHSSFFFSE